MASKRNATCDLNHDNWNCEDEPEEAGTFAQAPQEILEKRVTKTAKRRLTTNSEGTAKSAFGSFSGFKTDPVPTTSAFSFLTKSNSAPVTSQAPLVFPTMNSTSNGTSTIRKNGLEFPSTPTPTFNTTELQEKPQEKEKIFKKSTDYFAKLKGLNESVSQWIKSHVDSNPFCILTPIFRDYERYLKEIEAQHGEEVTKITVSNEKNSPKSAISNTVVQSTVATDSKESKSSISLDKSTTAKSIFNHSIFANTKKDESQVTFDTKASSFPQTVPSTFSFGPSTTTNVTSVSTGFSFGSGKPFSFGTSVVSSQNSETKDDDENKEDENEPPKPEIKVITEDGAVYEKKCKVFVKKDGAFSDRGVGVLFLKPTPNGKTQLIVRAQTALGNLLLNTLLTESIPTKRMNKNTVMLVCLPLPESQPPPTPILLRVKTSEDADNLLEALESNKK